MVARRKPKEPDFLRLAPQRRDWRSEFGRLVWDDIGAITKSVWIERAERKLVGDPEALINPPVRSPLIGCDHTSGVATYRQVATSLTTVSYHWTAGK